MSNKTQLQTNNASLDGYISRIQAAKEVAATLPEAGGVDLPELINEGFASDLMLNKELIDSDGNVITGTFTIDNELTTQDDLIAQIQTALQNKASASEPVLQTKTVTPTTSAQNVTPDSGYDGLSKVTVNAIPSSYVKPSATKAATTYTPTTSNQTIAAGTYCSGVQTISGDANLKAENIAEGVSIFGVTGTHSGGSSGGGGSIRVQVQNLSASPVYYWDTDGTLKNVAAKTTEYVDALNGTLHYAQEMHTVCNGPSNAYLFNMVRGVYVAMFLADNCIMTCYDAS